MLSQALTNTLVNRTEPNLTDCCVRKPDLGTWSSNTMHSLNMHHAQGVLSYIY